MLRLLLPTVHRQEHMLNYIWAGLIILSFVFGIAYDVRDLTRDTYRNDSEFELTLSFDDALDPEMRRQDVTVHVDREYYRSFYGV